MFEGVHELHDIGMVKLSQGFGFASEAFNQLRTCDQLAGENFDSHLLADLFVSGEIDFTHRAFT